MFSRWTLWWYAGRKSGSGKLARSLASAWVMVALGVGLAQAQTELLTFTGVWSTVPVTGVSSPSAVTGDSQGNLYITGQSGTSIAKIAADGTQTSIGSGLNHPLGIAADSAGNLYVTSYNDSKVYKITAGGVQTALASGWSSPAAIAVDSNGNVFVVDSNGLSKVTAGGVKSLLVAFPGLRGAAVDASNNIYYANNNQGKVYEILVGTTTPVSHNSASSVNGLYVDAQGNLFMARATIGVQRSDDQSTDTTTFGDTTVSEGVWEDSSRNLYIADSSGTVEKLALGPVDFGSVNVCPAGATVTPCSTTQTLHFALDGITSANLTTSQALTQGAINLDYNIATNSCAGSLAMGSTCSATLTFAPNQAGLRTGAHEEIGNSVLNNAAPPAGGKPRVLEPRVPPTVGLLASVPLRGIGIAPVGSFNTAPIEPLAYGVLPNADPSGVMFDANYGLYVTDDYNCVVQKNAAGINTMVAGTVCGTEAGDGGPAASATLDTPWKTALDGAGNLYIADYLPSTIRKVDGRTGIITTIAGNRTNGYSGDGGPATSAQFHGPQALALDTADDLFIADNGNNAVRRVDALTGIVTTVAGTGLPGYSGDGGAATGAQLNAPDGLAMDSAGNLYIADDHNNVIRKLTGGVITTIAGDGTAGYSGDGGAATSAQLDDPEGVAVDAAGNVYIADASNHVIRKVNVATSVITTVAGAYNGGVASDTGDGGAAVDAGLSYLRDVTVASIGEIMIADSGNSVVREVLGQEGTASFGSVALGSTPTAQDVIFSSIGTQTLIMTGLQVPANFNLGGADTTCTASTTLAVNQECVLGVEFAPTADGPVSGNLLIPDNFGNAPAATQQVALAGTATGAAPAKLAFPGAIAPIAAGGNLGAVSVDIEDATGAVVAGAGGLVTLTITGPGGYSDTLTATAVGGVAAFNLSALPLATAGAYSVTADSTGLAAAQETVTVAAPPVSAPPVSAPEELAIASSVPAMIPAGGNLGMVVVNIQNSSGALVTGATNAVTLTIAGPDGYSHTVTVSAVNGVSNFDLTSLVLATAGTYTLTATSGSLRTGTATATVTISPNFTIVVTSGTPAASSAILPGTAAGFSFTLAPTAGSFPSTITFTAAGIPAGAAYNFSPAAVTPGAGSVNTALTIQTVRNASVALRGGFGNPRMSGWGTIAFGLLLLPLARARQMRRAFKRTPAPAMLLLLLTLCTAAGLTGCGAGGLFGQPQQSYPITVTGTSGALSHSVTVTLTVQ